MTPDLGFCSWLHYILYREKITKGNMEGEIEEGVQWDG